MAYKNITPPTPSEPDVPSVAIVGDIAYWSNGSIKTTSLSSWSTSLGTPVGVVVIPSGFAPDGKVRIVSLKPVDSNGNQSDSNVGMTWGPDGNYVDTLLANYKRVPTTDNAGSTSTGSDSYGYLPSDKYVNEVSIIVAPPDPIEPDIVYTQSYVDPQAFYKQTSSLIPSPYLGDAPNPEYYKTISVYNNVLSDFNGLSNTQTLVGLGSDYVAANAAWKYKDGASNLQWYLPAMGELGYLMPRFNLINASLTAVGGVVLDDDKGFWSSSEYDGFDAYYLSSYTGGVVSYTKGYDPYVRPFCSL